MGLRKLTTPPAAVSNGARGSTRFRTLGGEAPRVGLPRILLRAEGLTLLGGALAVYVERDYSLVLAAVLFLMPDLTFAAYAAGPRAGAYTYDALHTTVGPLVLGAAGVVADERLGVEIALVWAGHIGMDRALGYGLKYPTAFKDTHLQRV
jgi:hypothetical protein